MSFVKKILVMSIFLFFIGCTADPALTLLALIQPSTKKTTIYPIPLPSTTTNPALRITANNTAITEFSIVNGATQLFKAIDSNGADVSSGTTWTSSDPTNATINPSNGTVSAVDPGTPTITATNASLSATATLTLTVQ